MDDYSKETTSNIKLPCFGIEVVLVGVGDTVGGNISSDLHHYHCSCKTLKVKSEQCSDCAFDSAMDGVESLILAHACAGIDIEAPAYIQGIEIAVQGAADNI